MCIDVVNSQSPLCQTGKRAVRAALVELDHRHSLVAWVYFIRISASFDCRPWAEYANRWAEIPIANAAGLPGAWERPHL